MMKQKFATLFAGWLCSLLSFGGAQPVAANNFVVADTQDVDNNLYSLTFNPTPPLPDPSSMDLMSTDLTLGNNQRTPGFTLADRNQSFNAFTALLGGTFASSSNGDGKVYLYEFGANSQTLTVSELPTKAAYIASLAGLNDGTLLALINPNTAGNTSFFLETIDTQSGEAKNTGFPFPSDRSFSGLTQCPDGTIYALASAPNYSKSLVQLDLAQQQVIEGPTLQQSGQQPINTLNLACSPQGDLFVTGVRNANANAGEGSFLPPDLFSVERNSGELTTVRQSFNNRVITFVPPSPALSSMSPATAKLQASAHDIRRSSGKVRSH